MIFTDIAAASLRLLPPETAHQATIFALKAGLGPVVREAVDPVLRVNVAGLNLPNPIGLAAGFDKNAAVGAAMVQAGFGWAEAGTVTPLPQLGNPRPRLFRLAEDHAVINRMGFNNAGLKNFVGNFEKQKQRGGLLGANIGANKTSDDRIGDYVSGVKALWGLPDWFTINISSPNTPGLRELQSGDALEELLGRVMEARLNMAGDRPSPPFFLKLAPDMNEIQIAQICEAALQFGVDGLIVSNTTLDRPDTLQSANHSQTGGLSGRPLFEHSTQVLRIFSGYAHGKLALIGVGGISSGADAYVKIRAGANAVQLYTAMAFHGPSLVGRIKTELAALLRADGFANIADAVGKD